MGKNGLDISKFGTLFFGKPDISPLAAGTLPDFTLTGEPPVGWDKPCQRLSLDTLPRPAQSGGDSTMLGTWEERDTDALPNDRTITRAYTSVDTSAATLNRLYEIEKAGEPIAVFDLTVGPDGKRRGRWTPRMKLSITGQPTPAVNSYGTVEFTLTELAPGDTVNLDQIAAQVTTPDAAGRWFNAVVFEDAAFPAKAGA
ncbi:MAG: hypothetical protein LBI33_12925 [Propionibacteriaceae bacterium]|jgi:hypothetical protein|nr:hypothetical protein [Propionibacteriaceae bacterium]